MRDVLTRLEPADRALLVTALNEIDTSLDIATALCADAGLDTPRTVRLLLRAGADPAALEQSMSRTVLDRNGRRVALFESASAGIWRGLQPRAQHDRSCVTSARSSHRSSGAVDAEPRGDDPLQVGSDAGRRVPSHDLA